MANPRTIPAVNYESRSADVQTLITRLQTALQRHAPSRGTHWGHCGDLAHVRARLVELVAFVENVDEAALCDDLGMD